MAEIAYLMGKESAGDKNKFFAGAKAYFEAAFAGDPANKVVTPTPFTLDAVLTHLAKETTTYSVIHIVTHADEGFVSFGLSEDFGFTDILTEQMLGFALDNWESSGSPWLRPLWARLGPNAGVPPVAVGPHSIIQIDGCNIGMCPTFIVPFGEMFSQKGTVRASLRPMLFTVERKAGGQGPREPVMGQARERRVAGPSLAQRVPAPKKGASKAAKAKAATERAAFDADFAQRYFDRILAAPEAALHQDALNDCGYVAALTLISAAASVSYLRPIQPWYVIQVSFVTRDVARVVEHDEAVSLVQSAYAENSSNRSPLPLFESEAVSADDCNFPLSLWEQTPKVALTPWEMEEPVDPPSGQMVMGTRIEAELVVQVLVEPILTADGTWLAQVDPTSPAHYATANFTARAPLKPVAPPDQIVIPPLGAD